jgi:Flp pilus assembly protein TadD
MLFQPVWKGQEKEELVMEQTGRTKNGTSLSEKDLLIEQGNKKFMLGDYQGAIADFSKAIELDPDAATAHYSRGLAYIGAGQKGLAKEGLMKAIELGYKVPPEALDLCKLG